MKREERYHQVLDFFRREAGPQTTELEFGSVFQLLCATLLSAQCTDKRVNAITPALFARFPDARAMAQASVEAVYELVRSVSYPNAKARHLVEMARMLTDQYGGEVPSEAAELVKLPGVGRGLPHGPHPRGGRGRRPPLAAAPRTLRLPERAAEMRGMSIRRLLPETDEG